MGYKKKPPLTWVNAQTVGIVPPTGHSSFLYIGEREFEISSSLEANLANVVTGPAVANTAYYAYGVLENDQPKLILDIHSPLEKSGEAWTYLGAVATSEAVVEIEPFTMSHGQLIINDDIEREEHTGDTNITELTFLSMPVTIQSAWMFISHNGVGVVESYVRLSGTNSTDNSLITRSQAAAVTNYTFGWVAIFTDKTVWMNLSDAATLGYAYLQGWQEDPELYP